MNNGIWLKSQGATRIVFTKKVFLDNGSLYTSLNADGTWICGDESGEIYCEIWKAIKRGQKYFDVDTLGLPERRIQSEP